MLPNLSSAELRFAVDSVVQASRLIRHIRTDLNPQQLSKDDLSPVTVADFAAQALVAKMLEEHLPGATLVGEEDAELLKTEDGREVSEAVVSALRGIWDSVTFEQVCDCIDRGAAEPTGRFWTLDPVDGTKGFIRGGQYAVALALIENGDVKIGVLGCPNLGASFEVEGSPEGLILVAVKGEGTWSAPLDTPDALTRIHVSGQSAIQDARLLRSVESGHTNVGQMGELVTHMGVIAEPVCLDSQAKYALLASGHGDVLFRLLSLSKPDYREKIWDQAAGAIVVCEAGGRITDLEGKPLDFAQGRTLAKNRGICATNGLLHETAIDALRTLAGDAG